MSYMRQNAQSAAIKRLHGSNPHEASLANVARRFRRKEVMLVTSEINLASVLWGR